MADEQPLVTEYQTIDQLIEHLQGIAREHGNVPVLVPAETEGFNQSTRITFGTVVDQGDVEVWDGQYEEAQFVHDDGAGERLQAVIIT